MNRQTNRWEDGLTDRMWTANQIGGQTSRTYKWIDRQMVEQMSGYTDGQTEKHMYGKTN